MPQKRQLLTHTTLVLHVQLQFRIRTNDLQCVSNTPPLAPMPQKRQLLTHTTLVLHVQLQFRIRTNDLQCVSNANIICWNLLNCYCFLWS